MNHEEATMNEVLENLEPINIDSYELSLYSYDEMIALAGDIEITKYKTTEIKQSDSKYVDPKRMTDFGAINDVRMGTMSLTDRCTTCSGVNCPGHWGIIHFGKGNEIMNPLYTRQVISILNCVCHDCSRLLFEKELQEDGINMTTQLQEILKKSPENRLMLLEKYCDKLKKCDIKYPKEMNVKKCKTHHKLKAADISSEGIIKYYKADNVLTIFYIDKIITILKNITPDDAKILGFIGETKPIDLIMQAILVMPPLARPPTTNKKGETIHNPFTIMYLDILKAINNKANAPGKIFLAVKNLLVKNDTKTGSSQKMKAIGENLLGKKGIYRQMMLGKRSDFCGRSVAGPGHSLSLNEAMLPAYWASILTKNWKVTSFNIDVLNQLLKMGRITHITNTSGFRKPVIEGQNYELNVGDEVDIHKEPGDRTYMNRQPSLSKLSMMSFKTVFGDSLVIRSHLSITSPYNLDYDGDELNIWNPRNFEVLSELEYIMDVENCIISTESGRPSMALNINSKTAGYLQSHPHVEIDESLYNDMIQSLLNQDSLPTLEERMRTFGFEPYRIDEHHHKKYYGRTAISALFPIDFEYKNKDIAIYQGVLVHGILSSAQLGTAPRSIVDDLAKFYGNQRASEFLTDAPHLLNLWIIARGFTVGHKDCINLTIDYKCEQFNKKYNKRAQTFDYEYNQIKSLVFNNKIYTDLQDVLEQITPKINKTLTTSLDDQFKLILQTHLQQLNVILHSYKPLHKCKQSNQIQNVFVLLRQLNQDKNNYKNKIKQILDEVTNIFKINDNNKVNDKTYRILKSITHAIEAGFLLSGQKIDLDYFYNQLFVDHVDDIKNIDNYIVAIYNITKDVDYDINLHYIVDVINHLNQNYVETLTNTIDSIITVLKSFKNCIDTNIKNIENTILLIFNESSLMLVYQLYINLIKELNKEYNKNILIKNEELSKIYLDIEAIGSKDELTFEQQAHHERLVTEKTDVVKAMGGKIAKADITNSIIMQTEAGSGTKGSIVNVGQIGGAVGQQYVQGKRLWQQYPRLSSHYDEDDESPVARGMIESSFAEGLTPTELFYLQGASRVNVIDVAMLTPLVGKLQRLLARSLENVVIAEDGSIRNANGLMYSSSYNAGFDITKTIKVSISDQNLNHFIDLSRNIDILNHQKGWYSTKELKKTNIKGNKVSLEDQLSTLLKKKEEQQIAIVSPHTTRKLSIYEKARIIGVRAEMINNNAPPRVDIGDVIDPLKIAQMEYFAGKLAEEPALFVVRKIPGQKEPIRVYPTLENI